MSLYSTRCSTLYGEQRVISETFLLRCCLGSYGNGADEG